jgi:hypothetical protein
LFVTSLLLVLFFKDLLFLTIISLFMVYVFNFSLIKFLWKNEKKIIILAFVIFFLRNVVALVGLGLGILNLLKDRIS